MMNFGRNFSPGDHIFDFGSGCGHQGAWLKAYYGMETFGIDMTSSAVDWATANAPGTYCIGDASNVSYVKDNVFDGAYSYAVLYHLPYPLQCKSVLEAIRIVKPHARLFLRPCISPSPTPTPSHFV
jgi:ubiquinone/menaquinone biosynthesis C-methylase UbiE